jgi:hypothetical protein
VKLFINPLIKRLGGLAILLAVLFVSGCNKDDPKPLNQLLGKWQPESAEPRITVVGGGSVVDFLVAFGYDHDEAEVIAAGLRDPGIDVYTSIEFKSDGKYEGIDSSGAFDGTWELSPDGKTLTLDKGTSDEVVGAVTKLDNADLVLEMDLTEAFGIEGVLEYQFILAMKRI